MEGGTDLGALGDADVLVTTDDSIAVCVLVADCVPVVAARSRRAACSASPTPGGAGRRRASRSPPSRRWRRSAPSRTGAAPRWDRASRGAPTRSATTSPRRCALRGARRAVVTDGSGPLPRRPRRGDVDATSSTRGSRAPSVELPMSWTDGGVTLLQRPRRSARAGGSRSRPGCDGRPRSIVAVTRPARARSFAYRDVAVDPVRPDAHVPLPPRRRRLRRGRDLRRVRRPRRARASRGRRAVPPAGGALVLQGGRRARRRPRRPRRRARGPRPARRGAPRRARRVRLPQRPRPRPTSARRAGRAARPRGDAAAGARPAHPLRRWHRLDRHGAGREDARTAPPCSSSARATTPSRRSSDPPARPACRSSGARARSTPPLRDASARGWFDGHVPVTAIVSALAARRRGRAAAHRAVVMSNERSSSSPTLVVDGRRGQPPVVEVARVRGAAARRDRRAARGRPELRERAARPLRALGRARSSRATTSTSTRS